MSSPSPLRSAPRPGASPADRHWLELVERKVAGLRYGVVQIVIHDGRVVQVEATERIRIASASPEPDAPA